MKNLTLGKSALTALLITTSSLTVVDLLRHEWAAGVSCGIAWLLLTQIQGRKRTQ